MVRACPTGRHGGRGGGRDAPTYWDLMVAEDGKGQNRSFLASEENFLVLKELHQKNLLVPVVGDFAGPKALKAIGRYLKEREAIVSAFYLSNVEQYLDREGKKSAFLCNASTLPLDASSTVYPLGARQHIRPWRWPRFEDRQHARRRQALRGAIAATGTTTASRAAPAPRRALDLLAVERPVPVALRLASRGRRCARACSASESGVVSRGRLRRRRLGAGAVAARRRGVGGLPLGKSRSSASVERLFHDDLILVGDDDALQLGNASAGGAEVERPDVEQRFLDRDDQQRALDHFRSLLIPQRDLRRDHLVLVDARGHLRAARRSRSASGTGRRRAGRSWSPSLRATIHAARLSFCRGVNGSIWMYSGPRSPGSFMIV